MIDKIKDLNNKINEVLNGLIGGQLQRKDRKRYRQLLQEVSNGLEMLSRYFEIKKEK